ncbi:MAG: hypothetical protein NVSMB45_08810 [Ginsengibacter sp.]
MLNTVKMSLSEQERDQISFIFSGECSKSNICPVKDIMATFGDKWSMYTILLLGQHQKMRFLELRESIKGISQRMLTVTLRSLQENGVVSRSIYQQIPPRVEYRLTELGESLVFPILGLASWANDHSKQVLSARRVYVKDI